MSRLARGLQVLNLISACLMILAVAMGYLLARGPVSAFQHISWGFVSALIIAFTHAMTMFYFAGIGVSMREAAAGVPECAPYLAEASRLRAQLAAPLGFALVSLMAAVILGGGSHTTWLSSWPHHGLSLAALCLNLYANTTATRMIVAQERLLRRMEEVLRDIERRRQSGPRLQGKQTG